MPILRQDELDLISHSAEQTRRLGVRLGTLIGAGDVICLSGDMGAGKTAFAAGVGAGWGSASVLNSPTYNLVHEHRRDDGARLFHLDCYRLADGAEAETLALDEIFDGRSAVLIEWPERIASVLPRERLWVELRLIEELRRNLLFVPTGARYEALIESFRGETTGARRG